MGKQDTTEATIVDECWTDEVVTITCVCGYEGITAHFDEFYHGTPAYCPECGIKYSAETHTTLLVYQDGRLIG